MSHIHSWSTASLIPVLQPITFCVGTPRENCTASLLLKRRGTSATAYRHRNWAGEHVTRRRRCLLGRLVCRWPVWSCTTEVWVVRRAPARRSRQTLLHSRHRWRHCRCHQRLHTALYNHKHRRHGHIAMKQHILASFNSTLRLWSTKNEPVYFYA